MFDNINAKERRAFVHFYVYKGPLVFYYVGKENSSRQLLRENVGDIAGAGALQLVGPGVGLFERALFRFLVDANKGVAYSWSHMLPIAADEDACSALEQIDDLAPVVPEPMLNIADLSIGSL
jgi:hypothetical protein